MPSAVEEALGKDGPLPSAKRRRSAKIPFAESHALGKGELSAKYLAV